MASASGTCSNACHRQGILDSAIRHAKPNDFASLRAHTPLLTKVCLNGKTVWRFADVIGKVGYQTFILPSSSPANAVLSFEQKREQRWVILG
ncbi:G-T/U mismatch-specific DNA glycosylase-like protein [Burkholderia cepacia]|nr:DNA glycosylase [Burkholderia cepacia ATCC 25416]SPV07918.1 G-T/U mismatch-specific DNA glycosylase-like protein [Burkholderia cepacia]